MSPAGKWCIRCGVDVNNAVFTIRFEVDGDSGTDHKLSYSGLVMIHQTLIIPPFVHTCILLSFFLPIIVDPLAIFTLTRPLLSQLAQAFR